MLRKLLSLLSVAVFARMLAQDPKPSTPPPDSSQSKTNIVEAETRDLKAGDEFNFRVEEDPIKSQSPIRVAATELGDAYFPVSRLTDTTVSINVRGKRLDEIRKELKEKLEKDYYQKATVTLQLAGIGGQSQAALGGAGGKVIFFGALRGVIPLPEGEKLTLSEAVLRLGGGGGGYANLKKVKLTRKDPETGRPVTRIIDVDSVIHKNDSSADVELRDGDRVEVPEKLINL